MKLIKSSALLIALTVSFLNLYGSLPGQKVSVTRTLPTRSHLDHKSNAATQIMTVALQRYVKEHVKIIPMRLGNNGEIPQSCILRMNQVGECSLYYRDKQFSQYGDLQGSIPIENIDDTLTRLDCKTMGHYLALNKIGLSRGSDQALMLRACMMGKGGLGPVAAATAEGIFNGLWTLISMRACAKAVDKMPTIIDGLCRGFGDAREAVATTVEMAAAGYKEVSAGKWVLTKILEGKLHPDTINGTVYTALSAMPEDMAMHFKHLKEATMYGAPLGGVFQRPTAVGDAIKGAVNRVCDKMSIPTAIRPDNIMKGVDKVSEGLGVAKSVVEHSLGGTICNETLKGAISNGTVSAVLGVGGNVIGNALAYLYDSQNHSFSVSVGGAALQEKFGGEGTIYDKAADKYSMLGVAANCFFMGSTKYLLGKAVYFATLAIPIPSI